MAGPQRADLAAAPTAQLTSGATRTILQNFDRCVTGPGAPGVGARSPAPEGAIVAACDNVLPPGIRLDDVAGELEGNRLEGSEAPEPCGAIIQDGDRHLRPDPDVDEGTAEHLFTSLNLVGIGAVSLTPELTTSVLAPRPKLTEFIKSDCKQTLWRANDPDDVLQARNTDRDCRMITGTGRRQLRTRIVSPAPDGAVRVDDE